MVIIPLILLSTLYDRLARGEEKYIFISDLGAILIIPVPFVRRRTQAGEFVHQLKTEYLAETLPYSYPRQIPNFPKKGYVYRTLNRGGFSFD